MVKANLLSLILICGAFLNPLYAQKESVLTLYFKSDSFNLSPREQVKLEGFIKNTDSIIIKSISITAWCDDVGEPGYNEVLSQKRANTIKEALLRLKIDKALITNASGKGEVAPAGKQSLEDERTNNRRAEVTFIVEPKAVKKETVTKEVVKSELLHDSLKIGDKITLDNILFYPGRHALLPESYIALNKLVLTVKNKTVYHFIINGHICCMPPGTDGLDTDTGVKNLSVQRAKTIYDYLVDNGVDPGRLAYKGLKADFPTGKGEKYDRRVEIEISDIVIK